MANKEIESVKQASTMPASEPNGLAELVGTWDLSPYGGGRRSYVITKEGKVHFKEENRYGQLQLNDGYLLLDFGDGKLERSHLKGGVLYVEHYNPKRNYPQREPTVMSFGRKVSK